MKVNKGRQNNHFTILLPPLLPDSTGSCGSWTFWRGTRNNSVHCHGSSSHPPCCPAAVAVDWHRPRPSIHPAAVAVAAVFAVGQRVRRVPRAASCTRDNSHDGPRGDSRRRTGNCRRRVSLRLVGREGKIE